MNDINEMPPVCAYCPYWEVCKPPYICPDIGDKKPKRTEKRTEMRACDCISGQEAIDALDEIESEVADGEGFQYEKWRSHIAELPSAQPKSYREGYQAGFKDARPERKKGKWVYAEDEYGIDGYHCNQCGFFVPWDYIHKFINYIEDYNFCPYCGAKMEGDDERSD